MPISRHSDTKNNALRLDVIRNLCDFCQFFLFEFLGPKCSNFLCPKCTNCIILTVQCCQIERKS